MDDGPTGYVVVVTQAGLQAVSGGMRSVTRNKSVVRDLSLITQSATKLLLVVCVCTVNREVFILL